MHGYTEIRFLDFLAWACVARAAAPLLSDIVLELVSSQVLVALFAHAKAPAWRGGCVDSPPFWRGLRC